MKFVRNDSKTFRFCRSKCHRNFNKKRNPRKVAWTKAYRKTRGKEMAVDTTFEFEARRNRPVKYDRDLMGKTITAMQRVSEIRGVREVDFYSNRMKDAKAQKKGEARVEIEKGMDLVAPAVTRIGETDAKRVLEKSVEKNRIRKEREANKLE
jgi:large subunit ribosomal protein L24e